MAGGSGPEAGNHGAGASAVASARSFWLSEDGAAAPPQYDSEFVGDRDLRHSESKRSSRKEKRKREEAGDEGAAMDEDDEGDKPAPKLRRNAQEVGKVSRRGWRQYQPAPARASSVKTKQTTSLTWEQRMENKAQRKAFQESKAELVEARRAVKRAEKEARALAKERKEQREAASNAATAQRVTNPATLKRIMASKKLRKKLVTV